MIILKTIILFVAIIFLSYRTGLILNKYIKKDNFINIILYGFITLCAILQIIYIPCILAHVSFNIVLYLTTITALVITIISFKTTKIKKEKNLLKKTLIKIKTMKKKNLITTILLFIIVFIQAGTSSVLFNENADDSFYVSLVHQNIDSEEIYNNEPSLGTNKLEQISRYMISGYELSLSVVSKIFSIPATTLCHTIIPFLMIIFSYMAYYIFARKFLNNEKAQIFVIILSVIFLFSGFTVRLRGIILLSRMWQGKEILLNIILTLILTNLISINKYNEKKNLTQLTILNFTGVFFTNSAIFIIPFVYMAFAVIQILKKNWKRLLKLLITGIPIIIYAVIFLIVTKGAESMLYKEIHILNIVNEFIGTGYYHILYIISIIVIMFLGNKRAKKYFVLVPIIYALTIYNPMFTEIITKYFTGTEVFWRLLWLLPIEFSIAYSFILILNYKNSKIKNYKIYKTIVITIEIILLITLGKFVYLKENGFEIAENSNKIPQYIIEQTEYILNNEKQNNREISVMAPPEPLHSVTMRQLTSKIKLFWSRNSYMNDIYSKEELEEKKKIYNIYTNSIPEISAEEFNQIKDKYKVNWIIIQKTNSEILEYMEQTNPVEIKEIQGYNLYKY